MSENRTSIILLADGDLDEVKACVTAIEEHTAAGSYELVVVALDPAGLTSRWLSAQGGLSLVTHERLLSTAAGFNLGINSSTFDNVLLLDSRVRVTAGYLPILLNALHSGARVGAVGPATNSIHGQSVPASYRSRRRAGRVGGEPQFARSRPVGPALCG